MEVGRGLITIEPAEMKCTFCFEPGSMKELSHWQFNVQAVTRTGKRTTVPNPRPPGGRGPRTEP